MGFRGPGASHVGSDMGTHGTPGPILHIDTLSLRPYSNGTAMENDLNWLGSLGKSSL